MSNTPDSASGPSVSRIERLNFNGTDKEDVTDFVREVKRIAMDQGRQRDQEWMVDYAESCLGGTAIRWFSQLDEISKREAMISWDALRQRLLDRFGPPVDNLNLNRKHTPKSSRATTPRVSSISGAPQPASPVRSPGGGLGLSVNGASSPNRSKVLRGHIKVVNPATNNTMYLKHTTAEELFLSMTAVQTEALMFEVSPSVGDKPKTVRLRAVDIGFYPRYLCLVNAFKSSVLAQWWHLSVCVEDPTNHTIQSEIPGWRNHAVSSEVWSLVGNELLPSWTGDTRASQIQTYENTRLYVFAEGYAAKGYTVVRFYFEPI
ncbi:hypothetical protein FRB94_013851 [Tulasnella sp. JGI-2019a]|nr:hypothetical protein FRB93_008459 [Tulasnella sp. JGI-2019a]KAG9007904.1 hypothetical protein FRB94_013851 [Tulasnella sp. JGI-2019a]KAG9033395.1 hypothetical protein FRB95_014843 [Tulasnella sp. JGI-2019a]